MGFHLSCKDYPWQLNEIGGAYPWVIPGWYTAGSSTITIAAGRVYYIPIFVSEQHTYDRIGIDVDADAGTLARLGIYKWSGGLPGALILDAGTVATNAIAAVAAVINQVLERGYYFMAIVADNTPTLASPSTSFLAPPVQGMDNTCSLRAEYVVLVVDGEGGQVAGGLADPAVAPTSAIAAAYCTVMLRGT